MWHGTSLTDPKVIYDSIDGFNTQFSRDNSVWGRAVYFAVNASYSCDDYAFKVPNGYKISDGSTLSKGTKVVILAKV